MAEPHYLMNIVFVIGPAVAVSWAFRMLRLPAIIGFLITGLVIGPSGLALISSENVGRFSELGLILLLFTVGLELSPEPLMRSGKNLLIATALQVLGTMLWTILILSFFSSMSWMARSAMGLAVALSSTAIVLKQISDRGETGTPIGLLSTGILLLQDVLVIVVLLVASLGSSSQGGASWSVALLRMGAGLAGLVAVVFVAGRVLPIVLTHVSRHGGRELITLFAVLSAAGGAFLAEEAGWSPALGACVAGLLLAKSDERHQLAAEITPFRDVFNAIFFISLGMSVPVSVAMAHLPVLLVAIFATLLLKTVLTALAIHIAGWPLRIGLEAGIALSVVSEFSYVLVHEVSALGALPAEVLDLTIAYTVGAMIIGALLYPLAGPLSRTLAARLTAERGKKEGGEGPAESLSNHVVIAGYGTTGANLARVLRATSLPHCVIEMNQTLVAQARDDGEMVIVGDATRMSLLHHAGIDRACVLVTAINDKVATKRIVAQVRAMRPELYILVRANFASDIDVLLQHGASLVVPEDFETSIEVAAHVLKKFGMPDNIIEAQVAAIRTGGYAMLRGKPAKRAAMTELMGILERTTTQTFYLSEGSYPCGRTLAEINLRAATGCNLIGVVRKGTPTTNPGPDFCFNANDVLVLVGSHAQIEGAKGLLSRLA